MSNPDRERLREYFSGPAVEVPDRWSKLWDAGDFLPFDRGEPNPALVDVLTDRRDLIGDCFVHQEHSGQRIRKKALVPGCGRGYDVLLLSSCGYDAYGLEISDTAVKRCKEEQEKNGHKYPVRDEAIGAGSVNFVKGDFFSENQEWTGASGRFESFELIYDYTVRQCSHRNCPRGNV